MARKNSAHKNSSYFSRRVIACLAIAAVLIGGIAVAGATLRSPATDSAPPETTTTTSTTTTIPPTTTTTLPGLIQPASVILPDMPVFTTLGSGSPADIVAAYQQRLVDLKFDPGPVDGSYGQDTVYAAHALQKLYGLERNGRIGTAEKAALETFQYAMPLHPTAEPNRTEIDVTKQVITLYENYQVRLITTTSTASGQPFCFNTPRINPTQRVCEVATTPSGRFTYYFFYKGVHLGVLGGLYNPFYFNKGIAVHGYDSVPTSPASHGCARIPMHIAEYFYTLVREGDAVYVDGGQDAQILSTSPIGGAPAAPAPEPVPTAPPDTVAPEPVPTAPPAA